MAELRYDFGLVGLGVMGRNFILNVADYAFTAFGHDLDEDKVKSLITEGGDTNKINASSNVLAFINSLSSPRKIMLLVPAGIAVDRVIEGLISYLEKGDIVIDGGNSFFTDTDRREEYLKTKGINFFGAGISGGAKGARLGPSIMPGGSNEAYKMVQPIFEAVAAKYRGEPCVAYLGPKSAGNYVKMVHNGIEYGLMQLTSEIYDILKKLGGFSNPELHRIFAKWNQGRLQSFLVEITSEILVKEDTLADGYLVDNILDKAKQKGTGKWTSQNAMDLGIPIPSIDMAVSMREISALKEERLHAAKVFSKTSFQNRLITPKHPRTIFFSKDIYLGCPFKLHYPSIDNMVELVRYKGQGCELFKRDLARAFRQFPVDPGDISKLGYAVDGHLFFDQVLPMGMRSSAMICQRVTGSIQSVMMDMGYSVLAYLDDFGGVEEPDTADEAFQALGRLLRDFGLQEADNKACPPSTKMEFLGILLDTQALTLEVTEKRLLEITGLVDCWLGKTHATRREIQSLVGKLNFVASCVRPGRVFISRMLTFMSGLPNRGKFQLSSDFRLDLMWWHEFLPLYNGVSMMPWTEWSEPDAVVACDACLVGCGGWFLGKYFHAGFPEAILRQDLSINCLEFLTLVVSARLWGRHWKGMRILVQCDNLVTVQVVKSGRTQNCFLQSCLRELCFLAATHEFEISAVHIAGVSNRIPDALSRWDLGEVYPATFHSLVSDFSLEEYCVCNADFEFCHNW